MKKIASVSSALSTSYDNTAADYEYKTLTASCSGTIYDVYAGSSYSSGNYEYWNGSKWVSVSGQHDFYADASYSDSAAVSAYALAYLNLSHGYNIVLMLKLFNLSTNILNPFETVRHFIS